jgi:hydrogenase expression/formation protein HypC
MCLGIPSKIITIADNARATIDVYGARREISTMLLEDEVKVGDYVLVHAGFAIQKLQEDVAKETLSLFDEYLKATEGDMSSPSEKKPIRKKTTKKKKAGVA